MDSLMGMGGKERRNTRRNIADGQLSEIILNSQ